MKNFSELFWEFRIYMFDNYHISDLWNQVIMVVSAVLVMLLVVKYYIKRVEEANNETRLILKGKEQTELNNKHMKDMLSSQEDMLNRFEGKK